MKVKIPLLRDRHSHPLLYASWMDGLNLSDAKSLEEAIGQIQSCEFSTGEILVAYGWLDSKFRVTESDLKSFPPIAVFNLSLHGMVMNDAAKELVETELAQANCPWDDQFWFEKNLRRILNAFAILNGNTERLIRFYNHLEKERGVIYAEEMLLTGEDEIQLFQDANLLKRTRFWCSLETWNRLAQRSKEHIQGIKIFADGALGVRTAAVNHPFDNGDRGMLMYSNEELNRLVFHSMQTERSVAIHAIGDRAIDQVVDCVEATMNETKFNQEIRIEHAQLISRETAMRAKSLGITLSMQPNFSIDSKEYSDRLHQQYCIANNPFRMLIDEVGYVPGADLIFGSDGMPHGVEEALKQSLFPPHPDHQRLTIEEFIAGYCDIEIYDHAGEVELLVDHDSQSVSQSS